jgi:hypothetical protein
MVCTRFGYKARGQEHLRATTVIETESSLFSDTANCSTHDRDQTGYPRRDVQYHPAGTDLRTHL